MASKEKQKNKRNSACRIQHSLQPAWWRTNGAGICMWFTVPAVPKKATHLSSESAFLKKCSPVTGLIIQGSNSVCPNSSLFNSLWYSSYFLNLGNLRTFPISWHAEIWLIPCWLQVLYVSIKKTIGILCRRNSLHNRAQLLLITLHFFKFFKSTKWPGLDLERNLCSCSRLKQ